MVLLTDAGFMVLETEVLYLFTEQMQHGKRLCNVPVCLNPDLEGPPLRIRGWFSIHLT